MSIGSPPQNTCFAVALVATLAVIGCNDRSQDLRRTPWDVGGQTENLTDTEFLQQQLERVAAGESPKVTQHPDLAADEYYQSLQEAVDRLWNAKSYDSSELRICTATVEHTVFACDPAHEIAKAAWEAKWKPKLLEYEAIGGCGCCVEDYMITGPRAAILEYPMHPSLLEYYPRWRPDQDQ
ncbi:hypothetical protein Enr13x_71810 [Stieleria neptunia]|uniref:Uncharacterized protein n=2 Tax=Stieleria neptunia TaxID=2527979 RepID=A0A518I2D1_9BACT|nr:hypothetical protein Enr13x_71810 [Stieleria neptunia]